MAKLFKINIDGKEYLSSEKIIVCEGPGYEGYVQHFIPLENKDVAEVEKELLDVIKNGDASLSSRMVRVADPDNVKSLYKDIKP